MNGNKSYIHNYFFNISINPITARDALAALLWCALGKINESNHSYGTFHLHYAVIIIQFIPETL